MSQRYLKEVHDFIRNNVAGRTAQELADLTNAAFGTDFTASSMKSYKANHKLRSGTPGGLPKDRPTELYPAEVAAYIQAKYKGTSYADMATQLKETFGRDYTQAQIMGYYKNHKLNSGLTGRFKKGHTPPNKGRKGYVAPGSEKGWFQKGSTPWDTVPVGTIVTKTDGYLWKKINDTPGVWLQNWKQLHLLIWEEAHGPVPEGYRVIFKDKNKQNCVLENLALVSLAENAVMNNCGLRFENAANTETGILIAKIKIAAGKRKKRRCHHERVHRGEAAGADPAAADRRRPGDQPGRADQRNPGEPGRPV